MGETLTAARYYLTFTPQHRFTLSSVQGLWRLSTWRLVYTNSRRKSAPAQPYATRGPKSLGLGASVSTPSSWPFTSRVAGNVEGHATWLAVVETTTMTKVFVLCQRLWTNQEVELMYFHFIVTGLSSAFEVRVGHGPAGALRSVRGRILRVNRPKIRAY